MHDEQWWEEEQSMEDTLAFIIKGQNDRIIKLAAFLKNWEQEFNKRYDANMAMRRELLYEDETRQMSLFP